MADLTIEPIRFKNKQGYKLFGMYHHPSAESQPRKNTAIVLLSPGVKMRVAPHRLYNIMAEHFAKQGFPVFRFDFWGLGDSEGDCPEEFLADLYGHIQVGRYVKDTKSAMDWLAAEKGIKRFIVGGLCGGAITGLLAGAEDHRCVGLLSIGIPVSLDSSNVDQTLYMTLNQRIEIRKSYIGKLLRPQAWLRLLTLKSDFGLIWRTVFYGGTPRQNPGKKGKNGEAKNSNINPVFAPKFFELVNRGCPVLLVFSGADRLLHEYEEKFAAQNTQRLEALKDVLTLNIVPNANHILSREDWKHQMLNFASSWLSRFN